MSDFESRLRAAMHAVVESPPPSLMDRVRRSHRRHVRRVAASWVASVAAVAIAIPPVTHALHDGASRREHPGSSPAATVTPTPPTSFKAAQGSVLSGCDAADPGQLGKSWQDSAVRLGDSPLWIIDGGHGVANSSDVARSSADKLELGVGVMVVAGIKPGSVVVIRVTTAGRPYLRFLYGPGDSLTPDTHYTMASGESGVTFVSCPSGGLYPGRDNATNYYGGFLTLGNRCVPVDISWTGHRVPAKVDFGNC